MCVTIKICDFELKHNFTLVSNCLSRSLKDHPVIINNCFHELLGNASDEAKTRAVAKCCGVKLTGTFEVCSHCARAKAKQAKREHVQALKDDSPTSHDEAWNHPDEFFESAGEKLSGRNFTASFM